VVTPASLSQILATLAGKASGGATVSAGGLLKGGNRIDANPALWLDAASPEDIVAGTASDKAITPAALAGLPRSLTPNGWITLPGGIRLMWVQVRQTITTEASFTAVYPDSFTEFVVPLAVTGWNAVFSNTRNLWMALGGTPGLSSVRSRPSPTTPARCASTASTCSCSGNDPRRMTMAKIITAPRAAASSTRRSTPTCPKTRCASPRCTMPG
jgi:hypothetical protein